MTADQIGLRIPTALEQRLFSEWMDELAAMTVGMDLDAPPPAPLEARANWVGERVQAIGYVGTNMGMMMMVREADLLDDVEAVDPRTRSVMDASWGEALRAMRSGPAK